MPAKILLVDDDTSSLSSLEAILKAHCLDVTPVSNVPEALKKLASDQYDVLVSDLHRPGPGDGLTLASAMRQSRPEALTILIDGLPEKANSAQALLLHADEILIKSLDVGTLFSDIKNRLVSPPSYDRTTESTATILGSCAESIIEHWHTMINLDRTLMSVPLSYVERTGYLPQLFNDLDRRLRSLAALGTEEHHSVSAAKHGISRYAQGYTPSMMAEESRILQVCIFKCLQANLARVNLSTFLADVMTIADRISSQLGQSLLAHRKGSHKTDEEELHGRGKKRRGSPIEVEYVRQQAT